MRERAALRMLEPRHAPRTLAARREEHEHRAPPGKPAEREREEHTRGQRFWAWFALAVLAFCWIAEATMCAERGF